MESGTSIQRGRAALATVRQLRDWTTAALALVVAVGTFALAHTFGDYRALDGYRSSTSIVDRAQAPGDPLTTHTADIWLLLLIAFAGALFIAWMWRTRQTAADLRTGGVTHGDAWVTLGWLPIANLVVPYALAYELNGQSDPEFAPGTAPPPTHGHAFWLLLWWLPTAGIALIFDYRLRSISLDLPRLLSPKFDHIDVGDLRSTLLVDLALHALIPIAALGAILVVRKISARLAACFEPAAGEQQLTGV